jgi:tRNA pseudouridine-54 N-methylase
MRELLKTIYKNGSKCFKKENTSPVQLLYNLHRSSKIIRLHEKGADLTKYVSQPSPITWVLGGHLEPPLWVDKLLEKMRVEKVSIGPISYLTSHVIAYTIVARNSRMQLSFKSYNTMEQN